MGKPAAGPARTVLIVDDQPADVRAITRTLAQGNGGWKVEWVDRLAAAHERLAAGGVDVVLLDLHLPDAHGLDTLVALSAGAPQVPVVVVTGDADVELGTDALRIGAQDHLVKGSAEGELLERVLDYAIERKRTADALVEAHKLESLGLLAGGIAHDFNNLLGAILGHTGLALSRLPPNSPAYDNLQRALHSAERAADRARQMLAYAGRAAVRVGPIELNHAIEDHVRLLRSALPANVALRAQLAPELPTVEGDASQVQQVLVNLILNGVDALGGADGKITVSTETHRLTDDERRAWQRPGMPVLPAGEYVRLEVRDDGRGIEPAVMPRIFEPFFSTRQAGRGLGLATVLGIVKGHGAAIRARSDLGHGATFEILFPTVAPPAPAAPAVESAKVPIVSGRGGLVLVVEDEPDLADATAQILKIAGYEAATAENGRAGLDLYDARAADVKLVLLDLSMPVMSGEEALRELRRRAPALPVILCSGFDPGELRRRFAAEGAAAYLQKPYTPSQLLEAIDRAVAARVA